MDKRGLEEPRVRNPAKAKPSRPSSSSANPKSSNSPSPSFLAFCVTAALFPPRSSMPDRTAWIERGASLSSSSTKSVSHSGDKGERRTFPSGDGPVMIAPSCDVGGGEVEGTRLPSPRCVMGARERASDVNDGDSPTGERGGEYVSRDGYDNPGASGFPKPRLLMLLSWMLLKSSSNVGLKGGKRTCMVG